MALNPKQFGTVMKNARMDKKLTQAELAEILDLSLSYLKDLERFKNTPSLEVFAKTIQYFNLSADAVIYPDKNLNNSTYQKLQRHLLQCDENSLKLSSQSQKLSYQSMILAQTILIFNFCSNIQGSFCHKMNLFYYLFNCSKISFATLSFSIIPIPHNKNRQSIYP